MSEQIGLVSNFAYIENNTGENEPIGERILGSKDPRLLTPEEFNSSPDLLFHGALSPFEFQRKIILGPNSQTIGAGFYVTDDRENAELYSKTRKKFQGEPYVMVVLPYHAKVLDMRTKSNSKMNAPVTAQFLIEYRDFIARQIQIEFPEGWTNPTPGKKNDRYRNLTDSRSTLNRFLYFNKGPISLREMISYNGNPRASEALAGDFTRFMIQKGYDGLVYNEGGDTFGQETTSYVFYNLEKIGTFDTWHQISK